MIDRDIIDPIEVHTDVTGLGDVLGDMVELVARRGQLQPRECQQRQPGGTPQSIRAERTVVLF